MAGLSEVQWFSVRDLRPGDVTQTFGLIVQPAPYSSAHGWVVTYDDGDGEDYCVLPGDHQVAARRPT